ncbi:glycosyltransferase, partial [Clostridium tarantellae]
DLPQYMNTTNKRKVIYDILKDLDIKSINKLLKYSDSFVLLTEYMKEKLNLRDKPYVVIEGICEIEANINTKCSNNTLFNKNKKIILYTGTLNEKYGVIHLVNAFKSIKNSNYELVFCGDGDSKNKIIEESKKDNRIILKGILPREEILKIQKEATVLVNPRKDDNEFCKYSFPSKLLEYLYSGVPIIAYKLRGITNEYDDYINYVEGGSDEALRNKILEICEKKYYERKKIAEEGRNFIIKNKSSKVQCEKILNMINSLFYYI